MLMSALPAFIKCSMWASGVHGDQKKELEPLRLELWMTEHRHVSAGNQTWSSPRVTSPLNYWALSPAPECYSRRKSFYYGVIFIATRNIKAGKVGMTFLKRHEWGFGSVGGLILKICCRAQWPQLVSSEDNTWSLLKPELERSYRRRRLRARDGYVNCFTVVIISRCMHESHHWAAHT
jgi:hypothetical protein